MDLLKACKIVSLFGSILVSSHIYGQETQAVSVLTNVDQFGFQKEDFNKPSLSYTVHWKQRPQFENFAAYWRGWTKEDIQCGDGYCGAVVDAEPIQFGSIPDTPINFDRQKNGGKYLRSSIYINVENPTIQMVANLVKKENHKTAKSMLTALLNRVHTLIWYPDGLQSLPMRSTNEILKGYSKGRVTGECKSFANLFVALSRAVGFPARLISGFVLSQFGPQGHVWAEVSIDGERTWIPVDPLWPNFNVDALHIPTAVEKETEGSGSVNDFIFRIDKFE